MLKDKAIRADGDQIANGLPRLRSLDFIFKTRIYPRPPNNRYRLTVTRAPLTKRLAAFP